MHSILYYHEKKYVCECTTGVFSTHFCSSLNISMYNLIQLSKFSIFKTTKYVFYKYAPSKQTITKVKFLSE